MKVHASSESFQLLGRIWAVSATAVAEIDIKQSSICLLGYAHWWLGILMHMASVVQALESGCLDAVLELMRVAVAGADSSARGSGKEGRGVAAALRQACMAIRNIVARWGGLQAEARAATPLLYVNAHLPSISTTSAPLPSQPSWIGYSATPAALCGTP
jgi:hypothetical protein